MAFDDLKAMVGRAAVTYVDPGEVLGVGTGSTVAAFLDALAASDVRPPGAVSSSEATSARLREIGVEVIEPGDVGRLNVYIDGADEIDPHGRMIKGGGGALTREKIVASMASRYVCLVDETKLVDTLGRFPVPIEVIPMAESLVIARLAAVGGAGVGRTMDGAPYVTDNGQHIVDVAGLMLDDPVAFEIDAGGWPGVVTVGVFARQRATVALVGTMNGVQTIEFEP